MTRPDPDDVGLDIVVVHDDPPPVYCQQAVGGQPCIRRHGHAGGCLPLPSHGPRSANDPIEGAA